MRDLCSIPGQFESLFFATLINSSWSHPIQKFKLERPDRETKYSRLALSSEIVEFYLHPPETGLLS